MHLIVTYLRPETFYADERWPLRVTDWWACWMGWQIVLQFAGYDT
jgi:hypothetical protein